MLFIGHTDSIMITTKNRLSCSLIEWEGFFRHPKLTSEEAE